MDTGVQQARASRMGAERVAVLGLGRSEALLLSTRSESGCPLKLTTFSTSVLESAVYAYDGRRTTCKQTSHHISTRRTSSTNHHPKDAALFPTNFRPSCEASSRLGRRWLSYIEEKDTLAYRLVRLVCSG